MTYLKKHNIFFISLFIFIISSIVLGFSTRALQIDQKALSSANALAEKGIINNNSNNPIAYKLSSEITRREMLKVMMNISGKGKNINCRGYFKDLSKGDWGCYYAEKALDLGYISANDYFRPNDSVSKIESLKMIFSAKEINVNYGSDWRIGYMNKAIELGITEKFSDYNTRAKRGWIFINADNTIEKIPNIAKNIKAFDTTIVFGASMIKESVEKNLIMYPDFKKELVWKNDKELSIKILENTKPNTDVFVNIKAGVKNIYGQTSKEVIIKKFKTLGVTKIDFVSPIGKITDLQKNITIRFSKPMVNLTSLDNQAKCPINISPKLEGKCIWISTSTFQFRPNKGFPIGAKYNISVPEGITSISGDKTIASKIFEISTPEFKIINTSNTYYIDKPILIAFNGEISLNNFKENFEINGFKTSDLNIKYFETPSTIEGEININKSIISIIPKSMSWGYDKSYSYKLKQGLKSLRGNISIGVDKKISFKTSKLLLSSNPFIYNDKNSKNKNLYSNLKFSANKNIITKVNPNILFSFYEEIRLNKAFFDVKGYDFDIKYAKKLQNIDGENILKDNKKSIILSIRNTKNIINTKNISNLDIKNLNIIIKSSKISANTKDIKLIFTTSTDNEILDYKFINYKESCLTTKNKIGYNINNNEKFNFNNNKKAINYISETSIYSNDKDCSYEKGKNKYIVTTKLNPNTKYNLIINKGLLDINNYSLDKEYSTNFTTLSALNEDKFLSVFDTRDLILVPKDLNPLGVVIQSQNLNKISVEICEGDFDISNIDYISNSECIKKDISIKNLGFETNYEELNLPEIFGKSFSGSVITLKIAKLSVDKNKYELNSSPHLTSPNGRGILGGKKTYIRTNKSVVIKTAKNGFMWLLDFKTGENLTDEILKIEKYSKDSSYTGFGKYRGESLNYKGEVNFTALDKGLYDLNNASGFLLITLKSGEKILINSNLGYYNSDNIEVYLTTDKPIYKPGETIKIKGIARKRTAKGYDLVGQNYNTYFEIIDSTYKQILYKDITFSKASEFTYEYKLKKDTKLGNYNLNILNNSISFSVEKYEKPDFKVISKSKKPYYIYGDIPQVDIVGKYYMGANLAKGKGSYRVSVKDYKFNSNKNPGYIWGKAPIFWLYNSYIRPNTNISTEIVNNLLFTLNNLGKAVLNINTDKTINNKIYTVSSTITDPNTKKSISSSSDFKLLKTNAFIGMKTNNYYYNLGDNAKIDFLALDLDENKLINESIKFRVYKIEYIYNKDTFKQEKNEKLLFEKSLKTNNRGESSINYEIKDYGELRFEISLGNGKHAPKEVLLGGKTIKTYYISGQNLVNQVGQEHSLKIIKNKDKYKVGEIAEFIISSPVKNVKALITVEKSNKIFYKKVIDIKDFSNKFELPIKSEYISNFDLKVFIIQSSTGNILPNYYRGISSAKVSKDKIKLKAEVKTNKTSYKPGEKAQITLDIKDFDGNPINGEALISITDESLLALKDNKIKIEDFFYKKQTNQVITNFSLNDLIKKFKINNKKEKLSPENEISGGGIRGNIRLKNMALTSSFASDSSSPSLINTKKKNSIIRTNFKDLAYYNALVKIVNGKATITVDKLPDNLTTWVVSGYVITNDTKIGSFESKIKVQKDLNLLPSIPRFFVSGDELEITANLINNSGKDLDITSDLSITNAEIISKPTIFNIKANSKELLVWTVKITPKNIKDVSDIIISVSSNKISDSIKLSRKIIPYSTPEYSFTNGFTKDLSYEEKINLPNSADQNLGQIDITLGASILTNLLDNINSIVSRPLNNFYSTVSTLNKASVLKSLYESIGEEPALLIQSPHPNPLPKGEGTGKRFVSLDNFIRNSIKEIDSYQNSDGGMMFYKDCMVNSFRQTCSNFELTGDFLNVVKNLEKSGYIVNKDIVSKALNYYEKELEKRIIKYEERGNIYRNIDIFYKILGYDDVFIKKYILSSRFIDTNYNFSTTSKLKLILLLKFIDPNNNLIQKYIKEFENNTIIEARGTLLPSNNFGGNNILSTTLGLRVFINEFNQSPHPNPLPKGEGTGKLGEKLIIENMARWLMAQKGVYGDFGNGYNTAEAIKAITDYIKYTGELKGVDFKAKGYLNSKEIISGGFDKSNKFSSKFKGFALKDYLKFGSDNSLGFEKTGTGKLYYDIGLRYFLPINEIEARDEGIIIKRDYYKYGEYKNAFKKECIEPLWFGGYYRGGYSSKIGFPGGYCRNIKIKNIKSVKSGNKGDLLVGVIEIIIPSERNNVMVNNFIPSGAEIVNINLNTTSNDIKNITGNNRNNYWRQSFSHIENRDDRLVLFADKLYAGTYKYTYILKLNHKGKYHNRSAIAEEIKKPEIWGRTNGDLFEVR